MIPSNISLLLRPQPKIVSAGAATTTLDPATLGTNQVLSNGNLTDTCSSSANGIARSAVGHSTGKYYCEVTIGTAVNFAIGVCVSAATAYLGSSSDSAGAGYGGGWLGVTLGGTTTADNPVAGRVYGLAIDTDNRTAWIKDLTTPGNWNANGTANPATNTNGVGLTANLATGNLFAAVTCGNTGDNATFNFGATAYTGTPPAGFVNW